MRKQEAQSATEDKGGLVIEKGRPGRTWEEKADIWWGEVMQATRAAVRHGKKETPCAKSNEHNEAALKEEVDSAAAEEGEEIELAWLRSRSSVSMAMRSGEAWEVSHGKAWERRKKQEESKGVIGWAKRSEAMG